MHNLEKTLFLNKTSFTGEEIKKYPYKDRKQYIVTFYPSSEEIEDSIKFYAVDDSSAVEYIKFKYRWNEVYSIEEAKISLRGVYKHD